MLLGNQGLVTQVNLKTSGNVVVSPLSTSCGWASTGGLAVTSTGIGSTSVDLTTAGGGWSSGGLLVYSTGGTTSVNIVSSAGAVISTFGTSSVAITDGTYTAAVSSNSAVRNGIWDYPTAGIPVKEPTGAQIAVKIYDGTNTMPTMDAAARRGYVQLTDGTNNPNIQISNSTSITTTSYGLVVINLNYVWSSGSSSWVPEHQST